MLTLTLSIAIIVSKASAYALSTYPLYEDYMQKHYVDGKMVEYTEDNHTYTTLNAMVYGMFFTLMEKDYDKFKALYNFLKQDYKNFETMESSKIKLDKEPQSTAKNPSAALENKPQNQNKKENTQTLDKKKDDTIKAHTPKTLTATTEDLLFLAYDLIIGKEQLQEMQYLIDAKNILKYLKTHNTLSSAVLGTVLLPAAQGYLHQNEFTLAPCAIPPFVMQKIISYDEDFKDLYRNTLQSTVRASGEGYAADYLTFNYEGDFIIKEDTMGTFDAARFYLWFGITASADPNRALMLPHYENMQNVTYKERFPPKIANLYTHILKGDGKLLYEACLLPIIPEKIKDYLRTKIKNHVYSKYEFQAQSMALFALGVEDKRFYFDKDGTPHNIRP